MDLLNATHPNSDRTELNDMYSALRFVKPAQYVGSPSDVGGRRRAVLEWHATYTREFGGSVSPKEFAAAMAGMGMTFPKEDVPSGSGWEGAADAYDAVRRRLNPQGPGEIGAALRAAVETVAADPRDLEAGRGLAGLLDRAFEQRQPGPERTLRAAFDAMAKESPTTLLRAVGCSNLVASVAARSGTGPTLAVVQAVGKAIMEVHRAAARETRNLSGAEVADMVHAAHQMRSALISAGDPEPAKQAASFLYSHTAFGRNDEEREKRERAVDADIAAVDLMYSAATGSTPLAAVPGRPPTPATSPCVKPPVLAAAAVAKASAEDGLSLIRERGGRNVLQTLVKAAGKFVSKFTEIAAPGFGAATSLASSLGGRIRAMAGAAGTDSSSHGMPERREPTVDIPRPKGP